LINGREMDEECCRDAALFVVIEGDKIHSSFDFRVNDVVWMASVGIGLSSPAALTALGMAAP
jgi:hypothetical protein